MGAVVGLAEFAFEVWDGGDGAEDDGVVARKQESEG